MHLVGVARFGQSSGRERMRSVDVRPRAGDLLIASVALTDGVFDQTVVLLLDHDESGSLGVILNKVSDLTLEDVLPQWADEVSEPRKLFVGGPVSPNGAICLASLLDVETEPAGWRGLFHHCLLYTSDAADDLLCVDL